MRHEFWGAVVATVGIVGTAGLSLRAAADTEMWEAGRTSIIVRTYTQPASAAEIRSARRTAGAILGRAGIQVVWLECGLPADVPADGCAQPLRRNELLVRILSVGSVDIRPDVEVLGFAFVDVNAGSGSLATVYADRVSVMAHAAGIDGAELLGRTMAHELGHLLLGTNRHARHGLMRASWSNAELRRNRATQWWFGDKEGELMRRAIAGRFRS